MKPTKNRQRPNRPQPTPPGASSAGFIVHDTAATAPTGEREDAPPPAGVSPRRHFQRHRPGSGESRHQRQLPPGV